MTVDRSPLDQTASATSQPLDFRRYWGEAVPYTRFVEEAEKNQGLWEGIYEIAKVPQWAIDQACDRKREVRLLVIAEDWCGDASNTVPILAKLGDAADCLEMRVIGRDDHLELIDRYLTNGARAIPVVIALDGNYEELGHWGPRPTELQDWVGDHKESVAKDRRYRHSRRWYAIDRGESTLREVLALLE